MDILQKALMILTNSGKFFEKTKAEKGTKEPFYFLLALSAVSTALDFIFVPGKTAEGLGLTITVLALVLAWLARAAMIGVIALLASYILTPVAKRLGGKSNISSAFKSIIYGSTPSHLLGWIAAPIASLSASFMPSILYIIVTTAISLWVVYITTKGLSKLCKMKMFPAFLSLLIAWIIATVIAVIVIVFLVVIIMRILG